MNVEYLVKAREIMNKAELPTQERVVYFFGRFYNLDDPSDLNELRKECEKQGFYL